MTVRVPSPVLYLVKSKRVYELIDCTRPIGRAYLSRSLTTNGGELLQGGEDHNARSDPVGGGCRGALLRESSCSGPLLAAMSSAGEVLVARGEALGGSGFRRTGEATETRGVCARNVEKEGTAILTGKACFWGVEEAETEEGPGSEGAPSCV